MAHKKGQGSSRNGRDSNPKMLGIKLYGGQYARPGAIICRQCGTRWHPGKNVGLGRDYTIWSLIEGHVYFDRQGRRINVKPLMIRPVNDDEKSIGSGFATQGTMERSRIEGVHRREKFRSQIESRAKFARDSTLSRDLHNEYNLPTFAGVYLQKLLSYRSGDMAEDLKDLTLEVDHARRVNERAFGVVIDEPRHVLRVPPALWELSQMHSVVMASGLVDMIKTFPSTVAEGLSLSVDRISGECGTLVSILHGHVDEDFLVDVPTVKHGFGYLVD